MHAALAAVGVRSSLALALPLLLAAACAPPAQGPLVGASDGAWLGAPEPAASAAPAAPAWDAYGEVQSWPPLNSAPFTSSGHQPPRAVDVRANPESRALYLALVTDAVFPDGTVLAELAHAPGGHGYAMRKVAGSFDYFELDPQGRVISSGKLAFCAGCHDQARSDNVFGLPREP